MVYLKAIATLLLNLPELLSILRQIGEAVETGAHFVEVRVKLGEFDKAIDKSRNDKDASDLEDAFNGKPPAGGK
jgi:hypothetical protein